MNLKKNILKIAKEVLSQEAKAIENLTQYINVDFERCILDLHNCKGRIVVTGIGKSAIIANKIVATLNSTGSPALFLHAADAIHGDLGMVQKEDMVICLSKSGNTPEIKVLVPMLKRRGAKLIALVSNTDSYLAQQADYVINASIEAEACPNNLAPTTSTTVHLALGDAIAVCLLELKHFSDRDFAELHPGGALGKQLYLKVGDVFDKNRLPIVSLNAGLKEIIVEISSKRLGATAVNDDSAELVGIITDGDLRRMLEKEADITKITAGEIMTANPRTIQANEYAVKALHLMQQYKITQLVVTEGNQPKGFIHLHDLLKEGIA
ncbi:MAG TPA: KpsF/GutQ family sugar-phosphate isomerase [Cyclobacteriaceae bacterium]|nr:KpsF/GutQ family sugar-phosphate isomerase [Cyclobacteriaceae bacterium]